MNPFDFSRDCELYQALITGPMTPDKWAEIERIKNRHGGCPPEKPAEQMRLVQIQDGQFFSEK